MDLKSVLLHTEEFPIIHKAIRDIESTYTSQQEIKSEITQENFLIILDEIFADGIINMGRIMCFIWIFKCLLSEVSTEADEKEIINEARQYYLKTLKSHIDIFG